MKYSTFYSYIDTSLTTFKAICKVCTRKAKQKNSLLYCLECDVCVCADGSVYTKKCFCWNEDIGKRYQLRRFQRKKLMGKLLMCKCFGAKDNNYRVECDRYLIIAMWANF